MPDDAHEEFRELCAVSMGGELTEAEWTRLKRHLSRCHACRDVREQYGEVVAMTIPAMMAEGESDRDEEIAPGTWSIEEAEQALMKSLRNEPKSRRSLSLSKSSLLRSGWKYAIAASILVALCLGSYQAGRLQEHSVATRDALARLASPNSSPQGVAPYLPPCRLRQKRRRMKMIRRHCVMRSVMEGKKRPA